MFLFPKNARMMWLLDDAKERVLSRRIYNYNSSNTNNYCTTARYFTQQIKTWAIFHVPRERRAIWTRRRPFESHTSEGIAKLLSRGERLKNQTWPAVKSTQKVIECRTGSCGCRRFRIHSVHASVYLPSTDSRVCTRLYRGCHKWKTTLNVSCVDAKLMRKSWEYE